MQLGRPDVLIAPLHRRGGASGVKDQFAVRKGKVARVLRLIDAERRARRVNVVVDVIDQRDARVRRAAQGVLIRDRPVGFCLKIDARADMDGRNKVGGAAGVALDIGQVGKVAAVDMQRVAAFKSAVLTERRLDLAVKDAAVDRDRKIAGKVFGRERGEPVQSAVEGAAVDRGFDMPGLVTRARHAGPAVKGAAAYHGAVVDIGKGRRRGVAVEKAFPLAAVDRDIGGLDVVVVAHRAGDQPRMGLGGDRHFTVDALADHRLAAVENEAHIALFGQEGDIV